MESAFTVPADADNIPPFSLPDLSVLASDYEDAITPTLSPMSLVLIFAVSDILYDLNNWTGTDVIEGLTDAEKDDIDRYVSDLMKEISDAIIPP